MGASAASRTNTAAAFSSLASSPRPCSSSSFPTTRRPPSRPRSRRPRAAATRRATGWSGRRRWATSRITGRACDWRRWRSVPKNHDLLIAASTIWVVVTAVLVMFMQAGFAFLEAGLTRMKNAGHIAGKNVLIFGVCSLVYWAVGFGLAFGDGVGLVGTHGFFPSVEQLIGVGQKPFDWFAEIPGAAGYMFEVVFAGVSLAIVWGAMAERAKLWVYFVFGVYFTLTYSIVSHWIWSPHGWLFAHGMQDFAGSTVVHYQGALAGLAGALILGPRIGKFGTDGRANPIPGHNIPYAVLGTLILWFGWFGFNPGSTLSVDFGGFGSFAYVARTTDIAAAARVFTGMRVACLQPGKPDD